jgi:hypothetical protein
VASGPSSSVLLYSVFLQDLLDTQSKKSYDINTVPHDCIWQPLEEEVDHQIIEV